MAVCVFVIYGALFFRKLQFPEPGVLFFHVPFYVAFSFETELIILMSL